MMRAAAKALVLLLMLARLAVGDPARAETGVLVVNGVAAAFTDDFIGSLKQGLGAGVSVEVVAVEERAAGYAGARVVVPLGTAAVEAVMADAPPVPVVASLVPRMFFERLLRQGAIRATALYLGQSFSRQLAVVRKAFPGARRIGVLLGPESAQALAWVDKAAREVGLAVTAERGEGDRLHGALRMIVGNADLLLVLPDPQVFNASSIQGILLETYRAQVPVVGISSAYTRAGAVLSLSASPVQLGAETAQLVRQVLDGELPPARHSGIAEVHVNRQVARSLGLDLPSDEALLSAARRAP